MFEKSGEIDPIFDARTQRLARP